MQVQVRAEDEQVGQHGVATGTSQPRQEDGGPLAADGAGSGLKRRGQTDEPEDVSRQNKVQKQDNETNLHPSSAPAASGAGSSVRDEKKERKRRVRGGDEVAGPEVGGKRTRRGEASSVTGEGPLTRGRKREREEPAHGPVRILRGASGPGT